MAINFPNTTVSGSNTIIGVPGTLASNTSVPVTNLTLNEGAWQRNTWITPNQAYTESISPVTASVIFANITETASYATQAGTLIINYSGRANPMTNVFTYFNAASGSTAEQFSNIITPIGNFGDAINTSNGDWIPSTGIFTCTTPGVYKFTANYTLKQTTNNVIIPQVGFSCTLMTGSNFNAPRFTQFSSPALIGLSSTYTMYVGQANSGYALRPGSTSLYCKYGDTFSFAVSVNTNTVFYLQQGAQTWVSIQQLA